MTDQTACRPGTIATITLPIGLYDLENALEPTHGDGRRVIGHGGHLDVFVPEDEEPSPSTPPPNTAPTIQGKDLKAWYMTAQNAIQEARRWKETSREKDVKDLETKVRCLEAVVRVSKGERDVARKQERRYKDEVERLNVADRDRRAVVREVAGLHQPCRTECLNPSHEADCEAKICKTCDHIWPCPTGRALEALTETTEGEEK